MKSRVCMKKTLAALIVTLTCLLPPVPTAAATAAAGKTAAAPVPGVTIQQSIESARIADPDVKTLQLQQQKAVKTRDNAALSVTYLPGGGSISSSYAQTIDSYQSAQNSLTAVNKNLSAQQNVIDNGAIQKYTDYLNAVNSYELAKRNTLSAQNKLRAATYGRKAGLISASDLNAVKDALDTALKDEDAAKLTVEKTRSLLAQKMNIDPTKITKPASLPALTKVNRSTLDEESQRAFNYSVTLWQAEQDQALKENRLNWMILNGTNTTNQDYQISILNTESKKTEIRQSVESAYYALQTAEARVSSSQTALRQAETALKQAQAKYAAGTIARYSVTGSNDLSSAELTVVKARMDLVSAQAALVVQKSQFYNTTGRSPYDPADWTPAK